MIYSHRLNKRFSLKFPEGYSDQQVADEGQHAQWPEHCNNNKHDVNNDNSSALKFKFFAYRLYHLELLFCLVFCTRLYLCISLLMILLLCIF